jgi:transcriptional regulator with XRE-family HTH domain
MLTNMDVPTLVRQMRHDADLSVRSLAKAAGVAASTVHRIEKGELHPTVETVRQLAGAAGFRLRIEPEHDYAASAIGLGRSIAVDVAKGDETAIVRRAAEFGHNFATAEGGVRQRMIAGEPRSTGDPRWDAFHAALVEWLAVRYGEDVPLWTRGRDRFLRQGWWVSPARSMRAWELAGSPISFRNRGIYLHRDSLVNV